MGYWASAGDYKINWLSILDRGSGSKLSPFGRVCDGCDGLGRNPSHPSHDPFPQFSARINPQVAGLIETL